MGFSKTIQVDKSIIFLYKKISGVLANGIW